MWKYNVDIVALHITEVCTHRCPMCYISEESITRRSKSYPIAQLKQVIDELSNNNVREISLLGGDPAKHPNILELVKYIKKNGMIISSLSNTHEYKNANFSEIAIYIDNFETTFHHYLQDLHDEFCKSKGAFANSVNKLLQAKKHDKKTGIALNITPYTADIVYNIIKTLVLKYNIQLD